MRVCLQIPEYLGSEVHHVLYLPQDWQPEKHYPLIVEYAGNGGYQNKLGDRCSGRVEDCCLGYGISAGVGYLWLCLPFVSADRRNNQLEWWGDLEATISYCKQVVPMVCANYAGDPSRILLAGFSRGAIACNFIGLADDEIAHLWRGFICHSHYDGVREWDYPGSERSAAIERLMRLGQRPQWISHEGSIRETHQYLDEVYPQGNFTFQALPFPNHTDRWVLRDLPERELLRRWCQRAYE